MPRRPFQSAPADLPRAGLPRADTPPVNVHRAVLLAAMCLLTLWGCAQPGDDRGSTTLPPEGDAPIGAEEAGHSDEHDDTVPYGEESDAEQAAPGVPRDEPAARPAEMEDRQAGGPPMEAEGRDPVGAAGRRNAGPPNIVLIFADDLGYGHLGSYGQRVIQTPNLDRLAADGVRFTQFYTAAPFCPPARTSLLTGLHTGHSPMRTIGVYDDALLNSVGPLLPAALQGAGYRTALFGKWGFNQHVNGRDIQGRSPTSLGFDEFTGFLTHRDAHVYYLDGTAADGHSPVAQTLFTGRGDDLEPLPVAPDRYLPDEFLDRALGFIEDNRDRPFFLYFPSQLPHAELVAPPGGLGPYVQNGRSVFPEERFEGNRTYPEPVDQPYATLAAMITRLDRDVGRIVDRIDRLGLGENTIIIFTSDNGPHVAGGIENHHVLEGAAGLDGRKFELSEGGIRVPMLARWTGRFPAGHVVHDPHALWDLAPTVRELAGAAPETTDGVSLVGKLAGGHGPNHDSLYWETYTGGAQSHRTAQGFLRQRAALRVGNRKIVRVEEEALGEYVMVFDISGPSPSESVDANLARDLGSCGWLPQLTERLNAEHRPARDGQMHPLEPLCQVLGGDGGDVLDGGPSNDRVMGRAGPDTLRGFDGDDHVFGGAGDDDINGNMGNDFVSGNTGNDLVYGGQGDDTVHGGKDDDVVHGDLGNDIVYGDLGNDEVYGDDGDDDVYGGDGDDTINGNKGNDFVQGNAGNDIVYGGKGDDTVRGGQGDDEVYGDLGNDVIYGDRGNDVLYGGEGDDTFVYGRGHDRITIRPFGGGFDRLRCEDVRVIGERVEGVDLILTMEEGGEIRIERQQTGDRPVDAIEGCR